MYIYIHPFVMGIIATLVFEVGMCFVVGIVPRRRARDRTTQPMTRPRPIRITNLFRIGQMKEVIKHA